MMQILLVILKFIGIVLAVVLGLLLFLFLLIMLAPIHYNAAGQSDGKISIESNISWLFFVLRYNIKYNEKGLAWYVRFLGFLVASNDEEFLSKKKEKQAKKQAVSKDEPKALPEAPVPEPKKEEEVPPEEKSVRAEQKTPADKSLPKMNIKKKITGIPQKVRDTIDRWKEKIKKLIEIKEFFFGEQNKEVMKFILKNFKKIMLHILPNRFRGKVEFGLEDPYTMGQILAVLGMLMPLYEDKLTVIPDFEEQKLQGEFSLKGRIIPGYLVLKLFTVILNKEVRRVIKEGRRLIGGNA